MALTVTSAREALAQIREPEVGRSITDLGMIEDLEVDGDRVSLSLKLMTPAYGPREPLREHVDAALKKAGAKAVTIEWGYRMTARDIGPEDPCPGIANIILVMSGK